MNAYQQDKLKRSLTLLRYLASLLQEARDYCRTHRRESHTVCVSELIERLCTDELVAVFRKKPSNNSKDSNLAELRPLAAYLAELIQQLEQEVGIMGDAA